MTVNLKDHIRAVPNFPKEGILFYDIGTLLANGPAFQNAVNQMSTLIESEQPDYLLAIESRGFLFGSALAAKLGIGMIMVRKKGKLPGDTESFTYELEYGSDTLEVQTDIVPKGKKVILIDDLLATGGTAQATIALAKKVGLTVSHALFLAELTFLDGRKKLQAPVTSLITYDK